jgi:hypothetical protein
MLVARGLGEEKIEAYSLEDEKVLEMDGII